MHPSFYYNSNKRSHWLNTQRLPVVQFVSLSVFLPLSFHLDIHVCLHFETIHYWNLISKHTSKAPSEAVFLFLFFPFFFKLSFSLIWNKLKASSAHHSCANVSNENQYASEKQQPSSFLAHTQTHIHAVFITILPVSEGKLQRSSVVALGFPPVQLAGLWIILTLTCKQRNSRNHHNYKIWSDLWIALETATLIWHMTKRGRDASVKTGRPHGADLGFSTWGAWDLAGFASNPQLQLQ